MVLALFGRVFGSGDVERSTRKERTGLRGFEWEAIGLPLRFKLDSIAMSVILDQWKIGEGRALGHSCPSSLLMKDRLAARAWPYLESTVAHEAADGQRGPELMLKQRTGRVINRWPEERPWPVYVFCAANTKDYLSWIWAKNHLPSFVRHVLPEACSELLRSSAVASRNGAVPC
jgi:hypothetical protein